MKIVKSSDPDLDTIHEAIRLRGLFVHRYSGIEFAVSELIIRARDHSHYNHLGDLPKPWEKKRKRLETLLEHDGPIKAYSAQLKTSFQDFDSFEAKRHFLVHALMTIPRDSEDRTTLAFSMYDHRPVNGAGERKSMVHAGRLEMNLEELDALVASLQPISTNFTALVARICREVPLPALKVG
jgi:hypothetical protein